MAVGDREVSVEDQPLVDVGDGRVSASLAFASYEFAETSAPFHVEVRDADGDLLVEQGVELHCYAQLCETGTSCPWGTILVHERLDLRVTDSTVQVSCVWCTGDVQVTNFCF